MMEASALEEIEELIRRLEGARPRKRAPRRAELQRTVEGPPAGSSTAGPALRQLSVPREPAEDGGTNRRRQLSAPREEPVEEGGTERRRQRSAPREPLEDDNTERRRQTGGSAVKLPPYKGDERPDSFLTQVRLAASYNGWTSTETAVRVALTLEGKALRALEDLSPHEQSSWPAIESALQRRFGRRIHLEDARAQLVTKQRRDGETLGAFAADLRQLARRGHPDFPVAIQEELTLQAFLRGLQPERLRELATPSTLEQAVDMAERIEDILAGKRSAPTTTGQVRQASHTVSDDDEATVCRATEPPTRPKGSDAASRAGRRCFRCGELGHIARYCPAPTPVDHVPQQHLN